MRPIADFSLETAAKITTVFTDIDDTLTTDGWLPAASYQALEKLYQAGIHVAPITGRPAGWCDLIARMWPVSGVVGENGAFYFAYDRKNKKMRREFFAEPAERKINNKKLEAIKNRVLNEVPGCAVSADQSYRDADLAIDFSEDVTPLNMDAAEKIKAIFEQEGAVAKISSIHVNCWFGNFDKLSMSRQFARDILKYDLDKEKEKIIFCGDSPNDAPMFGFFPNSCGVANVHDFKGRLDAEPTWVTLKKSGDGFVEVAEILLKSREK
jgi:HAD superfamily hydrolase (TIGR01484 family)